MLYNEKGEKIIHETNDKERMNLLEKIYNSLDNNIKKSIFDYLKAEIDNYFFNYENRGEVGYLKVGYIVNGAWDNTPLQSVYNKILSIYNGNHDLAFYKSKEIVGCLVRGVMIDDSAFDYLSKYFNGYVYSRS